MRMRERFDDFDPRTLAPCKRRTSRLADTVDDEDRGGIEAGWIVALQLRFV
jgi:hypothetical protein